MRHLPLEESPHIVTHSFPLLAQRYDRYLVYENISVSSASVFMYTNGRRVRRKQARDHYFSGDAITIQDSVPHVVRRAIKTNEVVRIMHKAKLGKIKTTLEITEDIKYIHSHGVLPSFLSPFTPSFSYFINVSFLFSSFRLSTLSLFLTSFLPFLLFFLTLFFHLP